MKQELQDVLYEKYPEMFAEKDLPKTETCMCWGICTDDGWYDLIDKMCNDLIPYKDFFTFGQMKEKLGGLRAYTPYRDDVQDITKEQIREIISKYEELSYTTCEICGAHDAKVISRNGRLKAVCPNHIFEKKD